MRAQKERRRKYHQPYLKNQLSRLRRRGESHQVRKRKIMKRRKRGDERRKG